jgi:hypothetical protein
LRDINTWLLYKTLHRDNFCAYLVFTPYIERVYFISSIATTAKEFNQFRGLMMSTNLIEELKKIEDVRTKTGRRHSLWLILLIIIMGTMSGYLGYRALGDFVNRHHEALIKTLKVPKNRLPSYSTIRKVMMEIDFEEFIRVLNNWAIANSNDEVKRWYCVDGKTICGSKKN